MEFKLEQFIKLDGSFYIVKGLTATGRPNKLQQVNKYGKQVSERLLTNSTKNGWDVTWEEATPLDPKYAKYEKVIAKMQQLDRRFKNRSQVKKDLTHESILDILTRLARQQHEQT